MLREYGWMAAIPWISYALGWWLLETTSPGVNSELVEIWGVNTTGRTKSVCHKLMFGALLKSEQYLSDVSFREWESWSRGRGSGLRERCVNQKRKGGEGGGGCNTLSRVWLCDPVHCTPPGSPVLGISQARITGVGCHFLLQRIFLTQRSNLPHLHLLHW